MTPDDEAILAAAQACADYLRDTVEADRGLLHDRHQVHLGPARAGIAAVMRSYFRHQREAMLATVLPTLDSHINQYREASKNGKLFASSVIPSSLSPLRFPITDVEDKAYAAAISDAIAGAVAVMQEETGRTAPTSIASDYLSSNSLSKLTGEIADTTKDRLRVAMADAWDAGGSYQQLVGAITDTFDGFSTVRAGMIAQTESVDAYNAGRSATARAIGFKQKSWETESGDPCQLCLDNEAAGWIDIDGTFPSGDSEPTAHVNCQCILNFGTESNDAQ